MTATSSRMSPGKWVLVGFCGVLVVLLAVFAQPDPFGSAAPAPSQAAPQESADADAALAEQQRRVREFFVNDLPRRQADDPPLSRSMVRMIGREFSTSDAAARRELGYVGKTSLADGMRLYRAARPSQGARNILEDTSIR